MRGGSEYHFNGAVIPFGAKVEYHPISAKDQSGLHQFGAKVLPSIFLGYVLYAGRIWNGDIQDLEQMDASETYAKSLDAKEVLTPMSGEKFIFPIAPGFHTTARETKRAHFRTPALQTPPKFHEKTPRETQKERNGGGKGKKKREILGLPPFGAPPFGAHPSGAPPFGAPLFLGSGLPPLGAPPFGAPQSGPPPSGPSPLRGPTPLRGHTLGGSSLRVEKQENKH